MKRLVNVKDELDKAPRRPGEAHDVLRRPPKKILLEIQEIFSKTLDPAVDRAPPEDVEEFKAKKDKAIEIGRLRFITNERKDGIATINGGFVPLNAMLPSGVTVEEAINDCSVTRKPIARLKIPHHLITGYVTPDREGKKSIDGIDLTEGEPLFCLSVSPTTNLTERYNGRIDEFLAKHKHKLFDLANPEIADKLRKTISDQNPDDPFIEILDIATKRVSALRKVIDEAVDKAFEGRKPAGEGEAPQAVITMGGAGSGKGGIGQQAIKAAAGDNFVIASLDDARYEFEIYKMMTALGHHADDYRAIADAAKEIRTGIADRARKEKYHILYDGSGIPYNGAAGTYQSLAWKFADSGYNVSVEAVDCMLYVSEERHDKYKTDALDRAEMREGPEAQNRTIPYKELIKRHVLAPNSYMSAAFDSKVKFRLTDNAGSSGSDYALAQKYTIEGWQEGRAKNNELLQAKKNGKLLDKLVEYGMVPYKTNPAKPDEKIFPPGISNEKVDYLMVKGDRNQYMFLVITDKERMEQVLAKAELNKDAIGPAAINYRTAHSSWSLTSQANNSDKGSAVSLFS